MIWRGLGCAGIAVAVSLVAVGPAHACAGGAMAGIVQRIEGGGSDVSIQRAGGGDIRPTPMQILCEGDLVSVQSPGAAITYRLEGAAASTVLRGPAQVQLPKGRRGATAIDNALEVLIESWMPDLRRSATYGTSRGPESGAMDAEWSVPGLETGAAVIQRGVRPLYVRWIGGAEPYEVQLLTKDEKILQRVTSRDRAVRFGPRRWSNGTYILRVYGVGGASGAARGLLLAGSFRVGEGPTTGAGAPMAGALGAEIRTASAALQLAAQDSQRWSLEALQMIDNAPSQGLDREVLYRSLDRDSSATGQP